MSDKELLEKNIIITGAFDNSIRYLEELKNKYNKEYKELEIILEYGIYESCEYNLYGVRK